MPRAPATSFNLNLTAHVDAARKDLKNYQKRQLPLATQRALNKTLDSAFTITKRVLSKHIGMTVTAIGARMAKIKAPANGTKATLRIFAEKVPSIASFKRNTPGVLIKGKRRLAGKGIRARVWDKSKVYPGSFLMKSGRSVVAMKRRKGAAKVIPKKGNKYVVKRGGTYGKKSGKPYTLREGQLIKRQPLDKVFGADLAQVFVSKPRGTAPIDKINAQVIPEFKKKLDHEISRIRRS